MTANPAKPKILLTGPPGCGKTTAIKRIVDRFEPEKVVGFYTQEIREQGERKGFRWVRLDGEEGTLAHVDITPHRVGKYGVDIASFEEYVVPVLDTDRTDAELFVIDEIGKMECLSPLFVTIADKLLKSGRAVLATVAQKGSGFISRVKEYPEVKLISLTRNRQDEVVSEIFRLLDSMLRP